ncbi:MAG: cytochrome c biogenesis protein CcdA [Prolixibacteraceae bacterium]
MKKIIFILSLLLSSSILSQAQIINPVKWTFENKKISDTEYELHFNATIEKGWHLYSEKLPEGGPIATSVHFENSSEFELIGNFESLEKGIKVFDQTFNMELEYFGNKASFIQKIKLNSTNPINIIGYVEYMSCNDETCTPPTEADFSISIGEKKNNETLNDQGSIVINDNLKGDSNRSLFIFFFFSFLAGLAAILTPCVFPMIPMTVSFFMHSSESKARAKINAVIYGLSIIAIYTIIGTLVAVLFGPDAANWLSTHWIPNIIFFVIFVVFAFSFFGMFEIVLPSFLVNKADKNADKGGLLGSFFMALTLVLVSFSCTGPIVGAILVESAGGEVLKPIIGMFGFALAFALPFTLFALFPQWLNNLPKSGGWLNSVKVVLGFVELALGLKFLSIADQTYHWGILDREVYIAIWIVIFTLLGLYLLGKMKFAHDSEVKFVSVPRLMLSIIVFSFVVYLIPGMFGAPLKAISGYMPPMSTHDFDLHKIIREEVQMVTKSQSSYSFLDEEKLEGCPDPMFGDLLHLPHGLEGYFDYEEGLACARAQNKPLFIDFTGHGCVNCREMEATVWSDARVLDRLKNDFVVVALYVDDKTKLPESEWITSEYDGKVKKTIGKKYADFQIARFGVNAQPYYVLLDKEEQMLVQPKARDLNPDNFVKFLDEALAKFKSKQ